MCVCSFSSAFFFQISRRPRPRRESHGRIRLFTPRSARHSSISAPERSSSSPEPPLVFLRASSALSPEVLVAQLYREAVFFFVKKKEEETAENLSLSLSLSLSVFLLLGKGGKTERRKDRGGRQMLVEVIYSLRKSKVRERGQKMAAILREAAAERGKFVNLSARGRKWRRAASRSALQAVLHFHGYYVCRCAARQVPGSACRLRQSMRRMSCAREYSRSSRLAIPSYLERFPRGDAFAAADSWMLARVIARKRVQRRRVILPESGLLRSLSSLSLLSFTGAARNDLTWILRSLLSLLRV